MRSAASIAVLSSALTLCACGGERPLAEQMAADPLIAVVDPGLPVGRFFVLPQAAGWADLKPGTAVDDFEITTWLERNGEPGLQARRENGDLIVSSVSGTDSWGAATDLDHGVEAQARTRLSVAGAEGASLERWISANPITSWPPSDLEPAAWNEFVRLADLGVALEMKPLDDTSPSGDPWSSFRLRALAPERTGPKLALRIEIDDPSGDGLLEVADAVVPAGADDEASRSAQTISTEWVPQHGAAGLRATLTVVRDAAGAAEAIRLHLQPAG